MEIIVHPRLLMTAFQTGRQLACLFAAAVGIWAQPGPVGPPKPVKPGTSIRLADLRRRLDSARGVNLSAQRALEYGRAFLASGEKALRSGQDFKADRLAEAADALLHVAEHQEHLRSGGGPKGPPAADLLRDHMQRVYFRTQQADYFFDQSHDTRAAPFPKWARDFYQLAVRAYERNDLIAADENAKCAEEVVRALEGLAQAATPPTLPLPRSLPPRPPAAAP